MILFLRNAEGKTLFEVEVCSGEQGIEVMPSVNITNYSWFLLKTRDELKPTVIRIFEELDFLRGWYHEIYLKVDSNPTLEVVKEKVREIVKALNTVLDLKLIED